MMPQQSKYEVQRRSFASVAADGPALGSIGGQKIRRLVEDIQASGCEAHELPLLAGMPPPTLRAARDERVAVLVESSQKEAQITA